MAKDKPESLYLTKFRAAHPEFARLSTEELQAVADAIDAAAKPHGEDPVQVADDPPSDDESPARLPTEAATTALAGVAALRAGLANVTAGRSHGGMPLLKMVKGVGTWVIGKNETGAEPGAKWAANPFSAAHGYTSPGHRRGRRRNSASRWCR